MGLQGTAAVGVDAAGDVAGTYIDSAKVRHGFVRAANGTITTFDAPGAGTNTGTQSKSQGTVVTSMDSAGDVAGYYIDANIHHHGFIRTAGGTLTTIDAPAANQTAYDSGTHSYRGKHGWSVDRVLSGYIVSGAYSFVRSASWIVYPFRRSRLPNQNYTGTQTYSINASGDVTRGRIWI